MWQACQISQISQAASYTDRHRGSGEKLRSLCDLSPDSIRVGILRVEGHPRHWLLVTGRDTSALQGSACSSWNPALHSNIYVPTNVCLLYLPSPFLVIQAELHELRTNMLGCEFLGYCMIAPTLAPVQHRNKQ